MLSVLFRRHLQTPFGLPSLQGRLREMDAKLTALSGELFGVPESVPEIDWSEYDDVQDKDAVQAIKRDYESKDYSAAGDGGDDNVSAMNATFELALQRTTENAKISEQEITRLKEELRQAKAEKSEVHNWTLEDYCRRYPGLAEQLRHEYMEGYTLPTDAMDRLAESDLGEARKAFQAGAPPAPMDPGLPTTVGTFDVAKEQARLDAQLKKMFGDSPEYEALVKEIDAKLGLDVPAAATPAVAAKH